MAFSPCCSKCFRLLHYWWDCLCIYKSFAWPRSGEQYCRHYFNRLCRTRCWWGFEVPLCLRWGSLVLGGYCLLRHGTFHLICRRLANTSGASPRVCRCSWKSLLGTFPFWCRHSDCGPNARNLSFWGTWLIQQPILFLGLGVFPAFQIRWCLWRRRCQAMGD